MLHKSVKRLSYDKKYRRSHKNQIEEYQTNLRTKRKKQAIDYKGGKCQQCGYDSCIRALTFHHRNPETKSLEISVMIKSNRSWESIKHELDECDLLCMNCHMEVEDGISTKKSARLQAISSTVERMPDERANSVRF